MRIAIPHKEGRIVQVYRKTEEFKVYEVIDNVIVWEDIIGAMGDAQEGFLSFLKIIEIDKVICGGMSLELIKLFEDNEIDLYAGAIGDADKALEHFLNGTLVYADNSNCEALGHE